MTETIGIDAIARRLSPRLRNCLQNEGIRNLDEVSARTVGELLRTPNFGRRQLNELREILAEHGKAFAGEVAPANPVPVVAARTGIADEKLRRLKAMYDRVRQYERQHAAVEEEMQRRLDRIKARRNHAESAGAALLAEIDGSAAADWKARVEALGLVEG